MEKFTLFQHNNKNSRHFFLLGPLLVLCVLLGACSTVKGTARYTSDKTKEFVSPRGGRADFDFQSGFRFYKEAGIYLGEIITKVHPNKNLEERPTALFVPFGLVQDSRDHYAVSQGVSRILYESFLAESTFAALEFSEYGVPYHTEYMLPYAREKGAEYLVGGLINQYFDGGAAGDSRFSVQVYVYHVASGQLMWSVQHSGVLPYKPDGEFAFFTVKNRMPVNPMSTLISVVGGEIALLLHYWTDPKAMKEREMREELQNSYRGYTAPNAF